ncbi:MAG: L-glutamate gamma-semialdehyde dehydrogenase [Tissierellia bacterium]|nr:L-glutamate gamma-semialdehyde dehydrogenase [Tissierellia bacterium]
MRNSCPNVLPFKNEKIVNYTKDSAEYKSLMAEYERMENDMLEIPVIIGGERIYTGNTAECRVPHDNKKVIAKYHLAGEKEAKLAIEKALLAREKWSKLDWDERVSIFMRAAALAAGPWRDKLNAATMLSQSKTYKQAEIDSAAELVDFFRSNSALLSKIYRDQPLSTEGVWNRLSYRPLEGFVFAVTPFNFTSICANLPSAPAEAGNVAIWKPSSSAVYSNYIVYELLEAAGLPAGVINFLPGKSSVLGDIILKNENLAAIHFTGSTETFQNMFRVVGENISNYKTFPRLVGETGGKNFVLAHETADVKILARALRDGAFEYQGQKCSAASRAYIPKTMWEELKTVLFEDMKKVKVGKVSEFDTFMGAVIDKAAYDSITEYIDYAKAADDAEIIYGGEYSDESGYFIDPTIILTTNPHFKTMEEEIFGPVLTVYLYDANEFDEVLELVDKTSIYGLTGSIFAECRYAIDKASKALENAAGNFYVNVRPTGAIVGQQPFGGARLSGTNDKAGAINNMTRWLSPRVVKEEFLK